MAIKTKYGFNWKTTKKYCQANFDSVMIALGESCKEAKVIVPLLKLIGMDIFDDGDDVNERIGCSAL